MSDTHSNATSRASKYWESAAKPPLRNHRPSTAPQKQKDKLIPKTTELVFTIDDDIDIRQTCEKELPKLLAFKKPLSKAIKSLPNLNQPEAGTDRQLMVGSQATIWKNPVDLPTSKAISYSKKSSFRTSNTIRQSQAISFQMDKAINDSIIKQTRRSILTHSSVVIPKKSTITDSMNNITDKTEPKVAIPEKSVEILAELPTEKFNETVMEPKRRVSILDPEKNSKTRRGTIHKRKSVVQETAEDRRESLQKRPAWGARAPIKLKSSSITPPITPTKQNEPETTIQIPEEIPEEEKAILLEKQREEQMWLDYAKGIDSDEESNSLPETQTISFEVATVPTVETVAPIELPEESSAYYDIPDDGDGARASTVTKLNPLTRLRASKYNLFSNTAGPFRGPGDAYYKFVMGGRSIRPGAKKYKSLRLSEVDTGQMDGLLIDKTSNRFNTAAWNIRALTRLRQKHKSGISKDVDKKQICNSIYTDVRMEVNAKLKKEHDSIFELIHSEVSDKIEKNEQSIQEINNLKKLGQLERKTFIKEFAKYLKDYSEIFKELEDRKNKLERDYDHKIKDLADLKDFHKLTFQDPTTSIKRIEYEVQLKNQKIEEMKKQIADYTIHAQVAKDEADKRVSMRAAEIIEQTIQKFDGFFNKSTKQLFNRNLYLKSEIKLQQQNIKLLESELKELQKVQGKLSAVDESVIDPRRKVLNMRKYMDCTPDMDIILPVIHSGI
ncbi:hypothetical protein HDV02_004800 [Globomyces sp. JEL0801]|nr:hypothetical protein HDV02_004800 [Globomyces sp. JEL0801]